MIKEASFFPVGFCRVQEINDLPDGKKLLTNKQDHVIALHGL